MLSRCSVNIYWGENKGKHEQTYSKCKSEEIVFHTLAFYSHIFSNLTLSICGSLFLEHDCLNSSPNTDKNLCFELDISLEYHKLLLS